MDPSSEGYKDWYNNVHDKLAQTKSSNSRKPPISQMQQKPQINSNSKLIMEHKLRGSTHGSLERESGDGNVHSRLYQAALSKQRMAKRTIDDETRPHMRTGSLHRSSSKNMPNGQYSMMMQRDGLRPRASSARAMPRAARTLSSTQASDRGTNCGRRLYEQGMQRKEEMRAIMMRARSDQDRQEVEGLSFHPQINEMSKNMRRVNNERPEDFLMKYGKAVKEKVEEQRVENLRKET